MEILLRLYRGIRVSLIVLCILALTNSAYLMTIDFNVDTDPQVLEMGVLVFTGTLLPVASVWCRAYDIKMFKIDAWRDRIMASYVRSVGMILLISYCLTAAIMICSIVEFATLTIAHRVPYGIIAACLIACVPPLIVLVSVLKYYINKISNRLENECHGV